MSIVHQNSSVGGVVSQISVPAVPEVPAKVSSAPISTSEDLEYVPDGFGQHIEQSEPAPDENFVDMGRIDSG